MVADTHARLKTFIDDVIYIVDYPIHYGGCGFQARMTIVRLADGSLWLHSPCSIDKKLVAEITAIGPVRHIIGPGNFHWMHLSTAHEAFPHAELHICPGIERKAPSLQFDWLLGDRPPETWNQEFEQVLLRGTRIIWEVAFFHRPTRTLILTDLVENIGDATPGVNLAIKFWWKLVFRMWNTPKPAPEYQLGWKHKHEVRASLERILQWDFDTVIISHGDLITENAKDAVRKAWRKAL